MRGPERGSALPPSGTVTFLFSDVEGSTERWARDRSAMQSALRLHDRLIRAAIAEHGGYVFKTIGDAFCAAFATPESAAAAALSAQRLLDGADFSSVDGVRVRMALDTGTADERDGDYFGPALNRVARLLGLGHGGQVLLSHLTATLVRANPPQGTEVIALGEYSLKGMSEHELVHQLIAPGLQRDFPELRGERAQRPWLVPDAMRAPFFAGRGALLARLRETLVERGRAGLSGLGGAGKTQTALEYATRHRADYPGGTFWVGAENVAALVGGFTQIAQTLHLPEADAPDQDEAVAAARAALERSRDWLLILDNVEDRREARAFVPQGSGHLLVTSREPILPEFGVPRALNVGELELDEATRFLLARTGRGDADAGEREAAAELASELGHLALALEQAAAYLIETGAAFGAYLSGFRKRRLPLLEKAADLISRDTVAVTWTPNFEAVERASAGAAEVIRFGALLAPDAIPFELFLHGATHFTGALRESLQDADDLSMSELVRPLARYSLIRVDPVLRTFGIHRLVQSVVKDSLPEIRLSAYAAHLLRAFEAVFPEPEFPRWALCERLIAHVSPAIASCRTSEKAVSDAALLANRAAAYLWHRGRYAEARGLVEDALTRTERYLGSEHALAAKSLNTLARIAYAAGTFADARDRFERALAIDERALGRDHPQVAQSLTGLAIIKADAGLSDEAQALFERVLTIREAAFGPEHPIVAASLDNLAQLHSALGRHAQAEPLHRRALAIRERVLDRDHPDIALSLSNLACNMIEEGRYAEALHLLERALRIWGDALGPDHPNVASGLHTKADAYFRQERFAEAEAAWERVVSIRERALGSDHPELISTLTSLALICAAQGRAQEAAALRRRALAIAERTYGHDHPEAASIRASLAASDGHT